jgi:hypothetical protein
MKMKQELITMAITMAAIPIGILLSAKRIAALSALALAYFATMHFMDGLTGTLTVRLVIISIAMLWVGFVSNWLAHSTFGEPESSEVRK